MNSITSKTCTAFCLIALCLGSFVTAQEKNEKSDAERQRLIEVLFDTVNQLRDKETDPQDLVRMAFEYDRTRNHFVPKNKLEYRYVDAMDSYMKAYTALLEQQKQPSPFWIGIQCEAADDAEIEIGESETIKVNGGMVVNAVTKDTPAAKAGIQTGDVILFINSQPTNDINQLVSAINENEQQLAKLIVIRDKQRMVVQLKPDKREQSDERFFSLETEGAQDDLLAVVFDPKIQSGALPEGYEVIIRLKQGHDVNIRLEKDGNSWEANAETTDQLPADVKTFAAKVIESTNDLAHPANMGISWTYSIPQQASYQWLQANSSATSSKLDEIQKQLDALQSAINELKKE